MTSGQFERTRRLALSLAGMELVERHRELVGRRGRRLGLLDDGGLDALLDAAEGGDAAAREQLLGLLTTKVTGFFRHPRHFDLAAESALRAAGHRGRARLWSAAAATGEEPCSLAMALIEAFGRDDPPASILATDIDAGALRTAGRGEYGDAALQGLSPARRERFLTGAGIDGRWRVAPAVRRLVELRELNLAAASWPLAGAFDVILCRNVLMYLEAGRRHDVLTRMAALLAPDGALMLDPAEHPGQAEGLFTRGAGGVYTLRQGARAAGIRVPQP